MPDDNDLIGWLFSHGGPILRCRTARDLLEVPAQQQTDLLSEVLATSEARYWLDRLHQARNIHGSRDSDAENALAKLLEYGLDRRIPAFAQGVERLLELPLGMWDPLVLLPLLVRAGYADHPRVAAWLAERVDKLYQTALRASFDFYLPADEAARVPRAWRGKPIYRDEVGHLSGYALPTCFDFYALAHCPPMSSLPEFTARRDAILGFLSDPRFQATPGGYGWDRARHRCYAAGRVFLACAEPARLVLFIELGTRFPVARRSSWFRQGLAELERHRTPQGTYRFPPGLLPEKSGSYIYAGAHMGLGENRRSPLALELESTFRMLYIHKCMQIG